MSENLNKLAFRVRATKETEVLAAFQYFEWAMEWRDKYCATGVISSSIMTLSEFLKDAKEGPPLHDADTRDVIPNGGIRTQLMPLTPEENP